MKKRYAFRGKVERFGPDGTWFRIWVPEEISKKVFRKGDYDRVPVRGIVHGIPFRAWLSGERYTIDQIYELELEDATPTKFYLYLYKPILVHLVERKVRIGQRLAVEIERDLDRKGKKPFVAKAGPRALD